MLHSGLTDDPEHSLVCPERFDRQLPALLVVDFIVVVRAGGLGPPLAVAAALALVDGGTTTHSQGGYSAGNRVCRVARLAAAMAGEAVPYPCLKSATDKAVAATLLVLASPVALCAVAGMAVDMLCVPADRGPFLYRERRISRGREFELLKLRVVRAELLTTLDADGYARLLEAEPANLTLAGRFLKRWYLDELPQLLNIVRGDISLVGPRPWPVAMVKDQIASGHSYRTLIQAGWTGLAQITKGTDDRVSYQELDLAYIEACRTLPPRRLLILT
jgi:lipopolysaccharide/colanic/teichoic acid biosynthesis glycosyltransferase